MRYGRITQAELASLRSCVEVADPGDNSEQDVQISYSVIDRLRNVIGEEPEGRVVAESSFIETDENDEEVE